MAYALVAGAALAFVNIQTKPLIEENRAKVENTARSDVLQDMAGGFEQKEANGFAYWVGYRDAAKSEIGGYIFIARGPGYSSTVETMVGVDPSGVIKGAIILFQQETPGLGAKVEEVHHGESDPWFPRQFVGIGAADDISVVKDGGTIDAITGATISSRAVTESIERGLDTLMSIVGG